MAHFDEKKGIVLSEEDKEIFAECEPKKYVVFSWKGLAKDWREYSDHLKHEFRKHDEDVRIKLWSRGNDVY